MTKVCAEQSPHADKHVLYRGSYTVNVLHWDFTPTLYFARSIVQNVLGQSLFVPTHTSLHLKVCCGFGNTTVY